jgi:hypothetical protein
MLSKYVAYLQIANHYVAICLLCVLVTVPIIYTFGVWAEMLTMPTLTVFTANNQSVNLVPYLGYTSTVVGLVILALVPGSRQVLRLERSHRNFQVGMRDVEEAFYRAYQADRNGHFKLTAEFDAIRERFLYLKSLPELVTLEPEILALAAQMSYSGRELAQALSNTNVTRAQDFLRQRKDELARNEQMVVEMRTILQTIRQEARTLALDEQVLDSEKMRLLEAINEYLAPLGFKAISQENSVINFPVPTQTPAE